jgi:hypothetical protein
MIIWSGLGIMIVVILGIAYFALGAIIGTELEGTYIHFSFAFIITGLVWLGLFKKSISNLVKIGESEALLENPERLSAKEKKRAETYVKMKKSAEQMNNSTLFFMPARLWIYILFGSGVVFFILHYVK